MVGKLLTGRRPLTSVAVVIVLSALVAVPPFALGVPALRSAEDGSAHAAALAVPSAQAPPTLARAALERALLAQPVGTHLYSELSTPVRGEVAPGSLIAVDSTGGIVYALSSAGFLTIFYASNGTAIQQANLFPRGAPLTAVGLAIDPAVHQLDISVWLLGGSYPGYVWLLDSGSLALQRNITSFGSDLDFLPWLLTVESNTSRLIVFNISDGAGYEGYGGVPFSAGVIDPSTMNFVHEFSDATCGAGCTLKLAPGLINDIPTQNLVVVTAYNPYIYLLNPANYSFQVLSLGGGYNMGPTAFDPGDSIWELGQNGTYTTILPALIGSFYPLQGFGGTAWRTPVWLVTLSWAPTAGVFAGMGINMSIDQLEFITFAPTGSAASGTYAAPIPIAPTSLVWSDTLGLQSYAESPSGADYLVTSTPFVNGSFRLGITGASPFVALANPYPMLSNEVWGAAADPGHGVVLVGTALPLALRAYYASNGSSAWVRYLTPNVALYQIGVDPGLGRAYVASSSSSAPIEVYSTTTGANLGSLVPPGGHGASMLAIDTVRHVLFALPETWTAGQTPPIAEFTLNLTPGSYAGALQPPNGYQGACAAATDSAADRLWIVAPTAASCPGPTVLELFNESGQAWVRNVTTAPGDASDLRSDGAGNLYVLYSTATVIGVYSDLADHWVRNITTTGVPSGGFDIDPADQLLWVAPVQSVVEVYNLSTGLVAGSVSLPALPPVYGYYRAPLLVWDAQPAEAVFPQIGTSLALLQQVPLPTVPAGLAAAAGNRSAHLSWTASTGSSGYPVSNYTVSEASASTGPWAVVATVATPSANVSGLSNGIDAYFRVHARSPAGVSGESTAVLVTPGAVPYPPNAPAASATASDQVKVSWSQPSDLGGSPVSGYTVEYATSLSGPWTDVAAGSGLAYTVGGLSASTTYYFRVFATNAFGGGPPSSTVSAATSASSSGSLLWILVGVVVVVAVAVLVALMLLRRRPRAGAPTVLAPSGGPTEAGAMPPAGAVSGTPPAAPPPAGPPPGAVGPPPP